MNKIKITLWLCGLFLTVLSYCNCQGISPYIIGPELKEEEVPQFNTILKRITVNVSGLSKENAKLFQDNTFLIAKRFVANKIDTSILPILILVNYHKGSGLVFMNAQYDTSKHFIRVFPYKYSNNYYLDFTQSTILLGILYQYTLLVDASSTEPGRIIGKFDYSVSMTKKNGEFIICSANFDEYGILFSKYIQIGYKGEILSEIKAINRDIDPRSIFTFFIIDLPYTFNGEKSPEYAAYKFFSLPIEKK